MQKKINAHRLASILIIILSVAIAIMLILIFTPILDNLKERLYVAIDNNQERTAYDSANIRFTSDGSFTAIYDYAGKDFVDEVGSMREFDSITPYGSSKDHVGKVILVRGGESGDIELTWIGRDEYRLVNQKQTDNSDNH